jgi:hypothetical protein
MVMDVYNAIQECRNVRVNGLTFGLLIFISSPLFCVPIKLGFIFFALFLFGSLGVLVY